jgi:surfeit locus 1 family protein
MQAAQTTMEASTDVPNSARFRLPSVTTFFNRRWWWITLLMLAGFAVLLRLGFWQLDRLEQRRAYNSAVLEQLAQPPISLNAGPLPAEPVELKNRQAVAQGEYDLSRQLALTHQNWLDSPGFHLITPLVLDQGQQSEDGRSTAVLVDRGWFPAAQLQQENWSQYDVTEPVAVAGYIQLSQTVPNAEVSDASTGALQPEWYRVDVAAIEAQLPYRLLPVYLQEAPSPEGNIELPFRSELDADLSEGNHFSYAIQWFIFATILGVGYVYLVGKKTGEGVSGRD